MSQLIDTAVIESFFQGRHSDPFSVLGMHETEQGIEIRVLMPDASQVVVIDKASQQDVIVMDKVHEDGFFHVVIPDTHTFFNYQLKVSWGNETQILEDPYRFRPILSDLDHWLLAEGTHHRPYEKMGAHFIEIDGVAGVSFTVWAPNAKRVSVVGDFNFWDGRRHPMRFHPDNGLWDIFIPKVGLGALYKFELLDANDHIRLKSDPYAFAAQLRPDTASQIAPLPEIVPMTEQRKKANAFDAPISIYEVHLGSWRRNLENNYWLNYDELAEQLISYVKEMGFTHIELMPINEFPFDGSWGYQPVGLYAPTSRFGTPQQFLNFVQKAHDAGLNVILDWVPGHFPSDTHGLAYFDGTALYEHADPREGYHQDWNTLIYNYGRHEVRNFLSGNGLYWLERFGIDGLRVDAVASMIYRDYSRKDGEWIPNQFGGRENLEAIAFLKHTNYVIGNELDGGVTIAEESTSFPGITHPPEMGGLGFHYKWNMGWMNDSLSYMKLDPIYRQYNHNKLTFGMLYNYTENFVLPLSHDEVVHGKGSLLDKMPGDGWQKFANLRAYYGFMWGHPGKKLLFMGGEFAQGREWNYQESLDWFLLDESHGGKWHSGVQQLVKDLNHYYQATPALYQLDFDPQGFEWLVVDDHNNSVFAFARRDRAGNEVIVISNFTPVTREDYRIGVNELATYKEVLNTNADIYCGNDIGNKQEIKSEAIASHDKDYSLNITIPPLATIYLQREKLKNKSVSKRKPVSAKLVKTTQVASTDKKDSVKTTTKRTKKATKK